MTFKARLQRAFLILPLLLQWFRFPEPPFQLPLLPSGKDIKPCVGTEGGNREGCERAMGVQWAESGGAILSLPFLLFHYRPSPLPWMSPPSAIHGLLFLPEVDRRPGKLVS